jgi:hypothetical protein
VNLTPVDEVFFLDLRLDADDGLLSENRYTFIRGAKLDALMNVAKTELWVNKEARQDRWELTLLNRGESTALNVWLQDGREIGSQGYVYFDQNYLNLFPGEKRRITAKWWQVHPNERCLEIGGWNTQSVMIKG